MTGESVMVYCWIGSSADGVVSDVKGPDTDTIQPSRRDVAYQGI